MGNRKWSIATEEKLPKFFNSVQGFAMILHRETSALEYLDVCRIVTICMINGHRYHRFEFLKQKES